jgi:hypothetical protein
LLKIHSPVNVIARLDRATQYSRASMLITGALEYWATRIS